MYIGDKIVYLELHKTGCSHVKKILDMAPSCHGMSYGKHNTIYDVPKKILGENFETKLKAGNVRNPWDWYVSLWAFGAMGKGMLHGRVTSNFLKKLKKPWIFFIPSKQWEEVYADASNPELFRRWLKMVVSQDRKKDIGEGYGKSKISSFIGLMTYRYLTLYTYDFQAAKKTLSDYNELLTFDKEKNMLDKVIKNESREIDLKEVMLKIGVPLPEIEGLLNTGKTNASKRSQYQQYYDEETRALVADKERFLIEKYNYQY